MDELALVTQALVDGAAAQGRPGIPPAARQAYTDLKAVLRQRYAQHSGLTSALEELESDPQLPALQRLLRHALQASVAAYDAEVTQPARHLLALLATAPAPSASPPQAVTPATEPAPPPPANAARPMGGIRAHKITAENVVEGGMVEGYGAEDTRKITASTPAPVGGGIEAGEIETKNLVSGWMVKSSAKTEALDREVQALHAQVEQLTASARAAQENRLVEELRREVQKLCEDLAQAIQAGAGAQAAQAAQALGEAEHALSKSKTQGAHAAEKLQQASNILDSLAKAAGSATQVVQKVAQFAPVALSLYQIALKLFGG